MTLEQCRGLISQLPKRDAQRGQGARRGERGGPHRTKHSQRLLRVVCL